MATIAPRNVKAAWAAVLCFPASILFSAANYTLFYLYAPMDADKMEQERISMGWSVFEMAMRSIMESAGIGAITSGLLEEAVLDEVERC